MRPQSRPAPRKKCAGRSQERQPERVRAATEDYRADSDPMGRFLAGCTARREGSKVKASDLWEVYERWCRAAAEEPVTRRRFGLILRDKGVPKKKIGVYYYGGLEDRPAA